MKNIVSASLLWFAFFVCAAPLRADDVFFRVPLNELKLTEGALPPATQPSDWRDWARVSRMQAFAVLDGDGEAVVLDRAQWTGQFDVDEDTGALAPSLLIRISAPREVTGRIFIPVGDGSGMQMARFTVPATSAKPDARDAFFEAQLAHYDALAARELPGAAWFRFRADEARRALGKSAPELVQRRRFRTGQSFDGTFALFTGGRAVSENLALDQVIDATKDEPATVDIESIQGITVTEIDWTALVKGLNPPLDPLASYIPADQHAVFFPSADAAMRLLKSADQYGTPVIDLLDPRSENAQVLSRYEAQLGISVGDLATIATPQLVQSIAITGGDPYFRVGTDVAILFESNQPGELLKLLRSRVGAAMKDEEIAGQTAGVIRSPDRSASSYLAAVQNAVVLSNSPAQLARIIDSHRSGAILAKLPEYVYFRNRYPRSAGESAFVMLSDATIRRWCGPRWRIADSRRTRAAAVFADRIARDLAGVPSTQPAQHLDRYGTFEFLTPIVELDIDQVTESEKVAYGRWRVNYQSNWRWAFDPIAAQLRANDEELSLDLSVMPLIWGTEYRQFISMSQGATIDPKATDQHGAIAHIAVAVNPQSNMMRGWGNFARNMAPGLQIEPLSWIGPTVSLYVDDDPIWQEMAGVEPGKVNEFLSSRGYALPIALRIQSNSALKLAGFVAAARAFVEQTVPGMTSWESRKHGDLDYVQVAPSPQARADAREVENLALYYAASGDALVLTLNEGVLKRSLDRRGTTTAPADSPPWIGSSLAAQFDHRHLDVMSFGLDEPYQRLLQQRSWDNLPILNEWKRRFPAEDPVKLHARIWHSTLVCPGGGDYVWNDQWQTMESTAFGSPGNPKTGPKAPPLAEMFQFLNTGVTFEDQGLRARAILKPRK